MPWEGRPRGRTNIAARVIAETTAGHQSPEPVRAMRDEFEPPFEKDTLREPSSSVCAFYVSEGVYFERAMSTSSFASSL